MVDFMWLFISHISLPSLHMLHCVDSSDFVRNCQSESLALSHPMKNNESQIKPMCPFFCFSRKMSQGQPVVYPF